MKKPWLLPLCLLISGSAFAQSQFVYYAGIAGGVNNKTSDLSQDVWATLPPVVQLTEGHGMHGDSLSGVGQIQLGAGWLINPVYLGLELSGQIFSGDFDKITEQYNALALSIQLASETSVHLHDFEFALDFKPGYVFLQQYMLYGRVGVGVNEVELTQHANISSFGTNEYAVIQQSSSETVYPWRLGLGLERHFNKNFSIVADYIYTRYDSISTNGSTSATVTGVSADATLNSSSKAEDITRQVVLLGLNYYFK